MSTYLEVNGHSCDISGHVAAGNITHIAVVFEDGKIPKFYVNGHYQGWGSSPDVDDTDTTVLQIGNNNELSERSQSKLKHLIICNCKLTDLEIRALYEASAKISESAETYEASGVDYIVEDESGDYLLEDESGDNLIDG